ncbi:MAG: hypothetical protein GTO41_22660, partial [Burkholderiales bacterium]|nr:hypothetical protein [Burkholderiales bacterium]
MLNATIATGRRSDVTNSPWFYRVAMTRSAFALREFLASGHFSHDGYEVPAALKRDGQLVRSFNAGCRLAKEWDIWLDSIFNVAFATVPYLTVDEWDEVW